MDAGWVGPDGQQFVWDAAKAAENLAKHGVSFEEAATVHYDEWAWRDYDAAHSDTEDRWRLAGRSTGGRLLALVYVERGDTLRLITARMASVWEARRYSAKDEWSKR